MGRRQRRYIIKLTGPEARGDAQVEYWRDDHLGSWTTDRAEAQNLTLTKAREIQDLIEVEFEDRVEGKVEIEEVDIYAANKKKGCAK